jgi:hypothetical protein
MENKYLFTYLKLKQETQKKRTSNIYNCIQIERERERKGVLCIFVLNFLLGGCVWGFSFFG